MKNTTNKSTSSKPTKATKNRITAFLLALLLAASMFSSAITAKADGSSTHEGSSGAEHGGSSGSFGDSDTDTSGIDKPTITTNEDGTRTLKFSQNVSYENDVGTLNSQKYKFTVNGSGKFVMIGYYYSLKADDYAQFQSYLLSDKVFSVEYTVDRYNGSQTVSNTYNADVGAYKGVHYTAIGGLWSSYKNSSVRTSGFVNQRQTDYKNFEDALKAAIDNGTIDLSKDDYISDEDKADMTPVRDESIGYLPRARYFDDRIKHSGSGVVNRIEVTSTIQWDSFQEPYATDLDNPYYIEIYAKLHYTTGHRKESNSSIWETDTPSMKMYQYKKFGEIKYISERFEFPFLEPLDNYLQTLDVTHDASGNTINSKSDVNIFPTTCYVSDYYVRLLHYDYEKQQLLCGGWTKLTLNDNGGSTSSEGDFTNDDPDGDWKDDPDSEGDKDWDSEGGEKDPSNPDPDNPNPDNPDFGIDTSDIGKFILSLITSLLSSIKSILILVGDFPDLCGHVFSFLPNDIGTLMFCGTAAIIFMRFLGR